ncbi:MAG: hypothetical protein WD011_01370 [Nitriliruptoraceae bacterium]
MDGDRRELREQLAALERYLAEMPPHNDAGSRSVIAQRIDELRARIGSAESRSAPKALGGDAGTR